MRTGWAPHRGMGGRALHRAGRDLEVRARKTGAHRSGAPKVRALRKNQPEASLHFLIRVHDEGAIAVADQTDGQGEPELPPFRLMAFPRVQAHLNMVQFCLAHHA